MGLPSAAVFLVIVSYTLIHVLSNAACGVDSVDWPDVALLQRSAHSSSSGGPTVAKGFGDLAMLDMASSHLLATLHEQPSFAVAGKIVVVRGVLPVFPSAGGYVAFIVDFDHDVWAHLRSNASLLSCAPKDDPASLSSVEAFGGNVSMKWSIVLKCAWPEERRHHSCHDVNLVNSDSSGILASYRPCSDPELAQKLGPYEMAACVQPVFDMPGDAEDTCGSMLLPQWLEFSVLKGVQHFVVYNYGDEDARYFAALRPYLEAGLVTQIRLTVPLTMAFSGAKTQMLIINDCLHRMRGRAKWLASETSLLEAALKIRYGRTWPALAKTLRLAPNQTLAVDARRLKAPSDHPNGLKKYFASLTKPTFIEDRLPK
eukprot:CAMPEP_0176222738 /NCGR_PEP_ID=MMETSP0121_2-20121125/20389_1 /TAXON_ID=160619 /ORGANISM="Kryptoperidinium foliaceum, Strain CCMP 1326" /LENGTH=370 /DNA_ID=CAMNT_0017561961 /DNA_START=51 /DNA_END=1163 /DNA_ORIENTATION=+